MYQAIKTNRLTINYRGKFDFGRINPDSYDIYHKNNSHIGYIQYHVSQKNTIELSLETNKEHQNKSYMTEALDAFLENMFSQNPNLLVMNFVINDESYYFHEKFGFINEKNHDDFLRDDESCYSQMNKAQFQLTSPQRKIKIANACEIELKENAPSINAFKNNSEICSAKYIQ